MPSGGGSQPGPGSNVGGGGAPGTTTGVGGGAPDPQGPGTQGPGQTLSQRLQALANAYNDMRNDYDDLVVRYRGVASELRLAIANGVTDQAEIARLGGVVAVLQTQLQNASAAMSGVDLVNLLHVEAGIASTALDMQILGAEMRDLTNQSMVGRAGRVV
jgi:hypothetical protein